MAPKQKERVPHDLVSGEIATQVQLLAVLISLLSPQERRMYVTVVGVNKLGPTDGCPRCACIMDGRACEGSSQRSVLNLCCWIAAAERIEERGFESIDQQEEEQEKWLLKRDSHNSRDEERSGFAGEDASLCRT